MAGSCTRGDGAVQEAAGRGRGEGGGGDAAGKSARHSTLHCLAAEPRATVLRACVHGGETVVAYEAVSSADRLSQGVIAWSQYAKFS